MGTLRIIQKGSKGVYEKDFPAFYMNDFSLLGLVVSSLDRAICILQGKGYTLKQGEGCVQVSFPEKKQVASILEDLKAGEIDYTMSDLVSCAYQG